MKIKNRILLFKKKYDKNGELSKAGKVDQLILNQAIDNFKINSYSQSLDIKNFDVSFARGLSLEDGCATITDFTAYLISQGLKDFMADLEEHNASDEIVVLVFSEFGRRMKDNGSGTDHGSGGGAFIIGNRVNGGLYSEYPSIEPSEWLNGEDLKHTFDYRGVYGTLLEKHLKLDPTEIVLGNFEQLSPFK